MHYLTKEIEALTKRNNTPALAKMYISCGIFQDIEAIPMAEKTESPVNLDPTH